MKPGRNDPCPCGSGKKYKKCCYLSGQDPALKKLVELRDIQDIDDLDEDDDFYDYEEDEDDEVDIFDDDYKDQEIFLKAMNNLRGIFLNKIPHIKKYYKIRDIHGEIVNTMAQYYHDGKFKRQIDTDSDSDTEHEKVLQLLECDFDLDTKVGAQSFFDVCIYKTAPNMTCITDDFIRDHRYRKPEKIEFLQSMLNSKLGLFEVIGIDRGEGYAYLKDVFTGDEYTIIDIGLSGNINNDDVYFYTRLIKYQDITFGTGLNFLFKKTDKFIIDHIQQHKKNFNPNGEFLRFTQLYNQYSQHPDKIKVVTNILE